MAIHYPTIDEILEPQEAIEAELEETLENWEQAAQLYFKAYDKTREPYYLDKRNQMLDLFRQELMNN